MNKKLETTLYSWPKSFIRDNDLAILFPGSANARYSLIKRTMKEGKLIPVKRGLYLIHRPYNNALPNLFEFAQLIYGPSYISLESALAYHHWIPEAVYTVTSVSSKRNTLFNTSLGQFHYSHIPNENFYMGVERVETKEGIFLIGSAWKALADYFYVYRKSWENLENMMEDLRIEPESIRQESQDILKTLTLQYPSKRVRVFLMRILRELSNWI